MKKQKRGKVKNSPKNIGNQKKKGIYNSRDDILKIDEDINNQDQQSIKGITFESNNEAIPNQKIDTTINGKKGKCPTTFPIEMVNKNNRDNEEAKDDPAQLNTETEPSRKYTILGTQEKSSSRTKKDKVTIRLKIVNVAEGSQNKTIQSYDRATHRNKEIVDSGNYLNTKQIEDHDILESENDLLFATPDKGRKKYSLHSEESV